MEAENLCPLCQSDSIEIFFALESIPTMDGNMAHSKREALSVTMGDITLSHCRNCDYIVNLGHQAESVVFDEYDFSLSDSPMYNLYQEELARDLIANFGLTNKVILEIGCGAGDFLKTLCEIGENNGIGIDPGFENEELLLPSGHQVTFIRDFYDVRHKELNPDFIICRLVIDLLNDPFQLLKIIHRNTIDRETPVFFEIFDAEYSFKKNLVWNAVYEHRSWLTLASVSPFFHYNSFEVLDKKRHWHDEYLGVVVKPRDLTWSAPNHVSDSFLVNSLLDFKKNADTIVEQAKARLRVLEEEKIKVIAWGAGARAVTFFNVLKPHSIEFIVDINHLRQGKYLPGTGQKIVSPSFVKDYDPDLIIITNDTYADEIREEARSLGIEADYWIL